jgi:hypothetical protein
VGSLWLQEHFKLSKHQLSHRSHIGARDKIELSAEGIVDQTFRSKYAPDIQDPLHHIEFSLKYDDLSLEFLQAVFKKIPAADVVAYIDASPTGRYSRSIGFLYEFLTVKNLSPDKIVTGNYFDLLDEEKYVAGKTVRNARWRINNNLLGNEAFCPIIRRTKLLEETAKVDFKKKIEELSKRYPSNIFHRAIKYLYTKETRSSYEIEKEKPSPARIEKFVSLLLKAGEQPSVKMLSEKNLTLLQNEIVDARFAATGFRNFQNHIGQSLPNYDEHIHYICPPPQYVHSMMEGLNTVGEKTKGISPIIRAAIIAFGFVFAHPFEDGNGRLHRFLIHDMLTRDGIVPSRLIIPVSAHMVNHLKDYDRALEAYSKPAMLRTNYVKNPAGEIQVTNPEDIEGYFRYPDFTAQAVYLANTILYTIADDMTEELDFFLRYDEVKKEMQNITIVRLKYGIMSN